MGNTRRRFAVALATTLAALASSACGAKTGLLVPDVAPAMDAADESDVFVRFDACVAGEFAMVRRRAQIMLVVDRSGSMEAPMPGGDAGAVTRWDAVRVALDASLPPIENTVDVGAIFYPRMPTSGLRDTMQACLMRSVVDVEPARVTTDSIISTFRRTSPWGATPTFDALQLAGQYFSRHPDRSLARYIVLATDGGPNCNDALESQSCTCVDGSPPCSDNPWDGRFVCLDDDRTVGEVASLAQSGIYTYVIGMRDDTEPRLADTLNRMAVAGQRTNPDGPEQFYDVDRQEQLQRAFANIVNTIAQCAYVTPSRPDDPDAIAITVAGASIPRDPTHENGWDWTDRDYGELTLYGPACDLARAREVPVRATVMCRSR
jgi:hypothetical protein